MPTYYAELTGGTIKARETFSGGTIYSGGGVATLQTKSVSYTPSESAISEAVLPDAGYDGMDRVDVSVEAIPSNYIGSEVPRKSSSDLSASGATVTAPAGYYENGASKAIPNASTPTIDTSRVDSTGKVTVDVEINNGGYIGAGTYQATDSVALPTQEAQTIYPSASDQSITSGKYLTGAQTIKGVTYSGLDASNIKKDVVVNIGDSADPDRIVSVTGTYEGGGGSFDLLDYTAPSGAYTSNGTTAGVGAFYGRTGITSLTLPSCTTCQENAFARMTNLETVSMASLTTGAKSMFQYDAKLETISLPLMTNIPENFLSQCSAYKNVVLPSATTLGASAFDYGNNKNHGYLVLGKQGATSSLSTLQNTGWNLMRNSIFSVVDCAMPLNMNGNPQGTVTTLILRSTKMSTLSNVNYRPGGVTDIYVPSALLSSYQSASNWSTLYSGGTITLTAIEGSYYETHYADGTTI